MGGTGASDAERRMLEVSDEEVRTFIHTQKKRLARNRAGKRLIWDECWALYRGITDTSDKEEWQSQITLPKSFNSVKQATNAIIRLLETADHPWSIEPVNPDDQASIQRGQQIGDLLKVFLKNADAFHAIAEGLESGFITGVGVWKVWWSLKSRERIRTRVRQTDDGQLLREIVQQEVLEGGLSIRAVDPYNFFWLPGSRFNRWTGTIEEVEISRYELLQLAEQGVFGDAGLAIIEKAGGSGSIAQDQTRDALRFTETSQPDGGVNGMEKMKVTEYYGPLIDKKGHVAAPKVHIIVINDNQVLLRQLNKLWTNKIPYVAFSPLLIPFRTDGVGIVEMARSVDSGFNQLVRLSMDREVLSLLPMLETVPEAIINPEDLETGVTPGKTIEKELAYANIDVIKPVIIPGISPSTQQLEAILDRAHQEGSFISEIQQALPRVRGSQTLGEIDIKANNQGDFLGALARDVDEHAVKPIVELSMDLMMQFLDTSNDPRVGSILGVGAVQLRGMSKFDILEMIGGDYIVKVEGVSGQVKKAEMLQQLIQFMNLVGQNEAWLPYLRQDQLLQRILEAFRPALRDIDNLIADPATVQAQQAAARDAELTPELIRVMPQLVQVAAQMSRDEAAQAAAQSQPSTPSNEQRTQLAS